MGSSAVHIVNAVVVTPSEPTPSTVLPLSPLDSQPFLRFTFEYLLIFEKAPHHRHDHRPTTTASLKSALARSLVPYYPLAGRVRRSLKQGSGSLLELEVVCRAQGAVFIEAASSDHIAASFEWAPRNVSHWRRLLSLVVPDVLQGAPALVVQLTWLRDGNAALGVGFNHCLIDGIGSGEFLNTFAELARHRGLKPGPVCWDRSLVDSINSNKTSLEGSGLAAGLLSQVVDSSGLAHRFSTERLVPTAVVFDKTSLDELKKAASAMTPSARGISKYTTFEALSGHVWRSWAKSLNLPSNQTLQLVFSVSIRNRVEPGFPNGYYGNAFVLASVQSSVRDLTAEKGLGHVTKLVKQAKDRVNAAYVRSIIDSVKDGTARSDLTCTLVISQWSTLGLERIDFGLGRPVHIAPICCDRYCLILPRSGNKRDDGVKVMVALPASAVDKYERLVKSTSCP